MLTLTLFHGACERLQIRSDPATASLIATGDLSFYRAVTFSPDSILNDAKGIWDSADARVGNLETVCTRRVEPAGSIGGSIRAEPEAVDFLRSSGVTAVTLANNHSLDYGSDALAETVSSVQAEGIGVCGVSASEHAAAEPAIFSVKSIRVAMLGYCDNYRRPVNEPVHACPASLPDEATLCSIVRETAAQVDVVIVQLHWGYEFALHPLRSHRDLARRIVAAGAKIVLCHHAHVPMGIEAIDNSVIAHGLGNCLFELGKYQIRNHDWTARSFLLKVGFSRTGVHNVELHPYQIMSGPRIRLLHGARRSLFLGALRRMSARLVDTEWLDRMERLRMVYEGYRAAAELYSCPEPQLLERAVLLRTPVNRKLTSALMAMDDACAREIARLLSDTAEIGPDLSKLKRVIATRQHDIQDRALPALLGLYRWRDALVAKLP